MTCPTCDGKGYVEEYGEYRMICDCKDGIAICICGDYATRVNDEGVPQCDREFFAWEREYAA